MVAGKKSHRGFDQIERRAARRVVWMWTARFSERKLNGRNRETEEKKLRATLTSENFWRIKTLMRSRFATPHHWHALGAIWAAQAGKDVYVEKPASHNVWEGRKMVEAARKYDRIMQGRNAVVAPALVCKEAIAWLRGGQLGKNHSCARALLQTSRQHRQNHRPNSRFLKRSIMIYGVVPRRLTRHAATARRTAASITSGIGSGNTATATSVIKAFIRWTIARWVLGETGTFAARHQHRRTFGFMRTMPSRRTRRLFFTITKSAPLILKWRGLPAAAESSKMDEYYGAKYRRCG